MGKLGIYLRRLWLNLILGAMLVLLVISSLMAPMGPRDLAALRAHRTLLEADRDRLIAENREISDRARRLQSDDAYLERLIRRELGYARADELVYRFPHPATNTNQ
jgi:cell division protein FtsB